MMCDTGFLGRDRFALNCIDCVPRDRQRRREHILRRETESFELIQVANLSSCSRRMRKRQLTRLGAAAALQMVYLAAHGQEAMIIGKGAESKVKILGANSPIEKNVPATCLMWSPSGQNLAVLEEHSGTLGWMTKEGAAIKIAEKVRNPKWSPDGSRLMYDALGGALVVSKVGSLDSGSSADGARTVAAGVRLGTSTWSPDGYRVAFGAHDGLWVTDLGGVTPRQIVKGRKIVCSDWAQDGGEIGFVDTKGFLFEVRPNGAGIHQIGKIAANRIQWSPNGRYILAETKSGWSTVRAATGTVEPLACDPGVRPTWVGAQRLIVVEKGVAVKVHVGSRDKDEILHPIGADEKETIAFWATKPQMDITNESITNDGFHGARAPYDNEMRLTGFVEMADPMEGRYVLRVDSMVDFKGSETVYAQPVAQTVSWAEGARQTDGKHTRSLPMEEMREDDRVTIVVQGPRLGKDAKLAVREAWIDGAVFGEDVQPVEHAVRLFDPSIDYDGVTRDSVALKIVFPVAGHVSWSDTFLAPRGNGTRRHHGQDIMGKMMTPLVACVDGTIRLGRSHGISGNCIYLDGDNGWRAFYCHLNDNTPGTNDSRGGDQYAFAPGLVSGMHVHAGQFIGYLGNSGNAKSTAPHLHFEIKDRVTGAIINPAQSLRMAMRLAEPAEDPLDRIVSSAPEKVVRAKRTSRYEGLVASRKGGRSGRVVDTIMSYRPIIEECSQQFDVDPALVAAVIQQESQGDPLCVSRAGAMGLMQLMPQTAADCGVDDPYDPGQNIRGGVKFLAEMLKRFDGSVEKALIAYNAGPGRVTNGSWMGLSETRAYVPAVLRYYRALKDVGLQDSPKPQEVAGLAPPSYVPPPSTKDLDQMLEVIRAARGQGPLGAIENGVLDRVATRLINERISGGKQIQDVRSKAAKFATQGGYKPGVMNAIVFTTDSEDAFASEWAAKGPLAGRYVGLSHNFKKGHHYWAVILDTQ